MKKNIIIATVVAASALLVSISCTKQDDVQSVSEAKVFTATIGQELTKTTLKETLVYWNEKDLININGSEYSATPNREKPASATFTLESGVSPQAPYSAIYPASLYYNKGEYRFPDVQYYQDGRFNAPMYAGGNSENLTFSNICGVLCLNLLSSDDSETIVRRIVLKANGELVSGPFKVGKEDGTGNWCALMTGGDNSSNTVTLDCGEEGVALYPDKATAFYISLPPQKYKADMTVSIESTNPACSAYETQTSYPVEIYSNSVYPFTWGVRFAQNAAPAVQYVHRDPTTSEIPGIFSVGPGDRDKVYFTKGNLQARYISEGYAFGFADNQFDFFGNDSGNAKLFYDGTLQDGDVIDLFCWSVKDDEHDNNYGILSDVNGEFYDWAHSIDAEYWRTLSGGEGGEWEYLIDKRVVNGNTGAGYSYELIKGEEISGQNVTGVAIFPDGFTSQTTWKSYTWDKIAEAGIVFLPLAGYFASWTGSNDAFWDDCVHYWSNYEKNRYGYSLCYEPGDDPDNFPAYFSAAHSVPSKEDRCAVRLVANAFVPAPAVIDEPKVVVGQ